VVIAMIRCDNKRHEIIIVENAVQLIVAEAVAARERGVREAGGSLLGLQSPRRSTILYALPTGINADQSGAHIVTDADSQNRWIRLLCGHHARRGVRIGYLCDYHSHTEWYPRLSGVDEDACTAILSDPDHADLCGLPLILVTFRPNGTPVIVPFWVTLQGKKLVVESAHLERVSAADKRIKAALRGCTYRPFESLVREESADLPANGTSDATASAKQPGDLLSIRIEVEMADIERVLATPATLQKTPAGMPFLTLTNNETTLVAAIPSEFPLNPPLVFMRRGGASGFQEYRAGLPWNSLARISDLFEEVLNSTTKQGEDNHE
jgi:hypothetical protein